MEEESLPARVEVRNPCTHNTWDDGKYVTYEIKIETDHSSFHLKSSTTRRRYSDFAWLRKKLKQHHPHVNPPDLPPKKLMQVFFFGNDDDFLESRRKGLEDFMNKLQAERLYLSDSTFHLFLQTDLTSKQISQYLEGGLPDKDLDKVWQNGGMQGDLLGLDLNSYPEVAGDKLRLDSQGGLRQVDQGTDSGVGGDNSSIGESSVSSQEDRLPQWQTGQASRASPHFSINGEEDEEEMEDSRCEDVDIH